VATVGAIQSVNNAACSTIGKMLNASEKYAEEATAVWHANHFAIFMFGQNQHNKESIGIFTETFAGAGGARTYADGVDVGGEIPNPISRMANVETTENTFPIRYLFRRKMTDSGGAGRYRGGSGMEFAVVPHDAPDGGIDYVTSGKGSKFPMSEGLGGGYPGSPNSYLWVKNNELKPEQQDSAIFSQSIDDMEAAKEVVDWGVFPLRGKDALYVSWNGGGGYGDPLDRPVEEVLSDISNGNTSVEFAYDIYGVVTNGEGLVEEEATEDRRATLLATRKTA
jgi:N-methylhydantoinase B